MGFIEPTDYFLSERTEVEVEVVRVERGGWVVVGLVGRFSEDEHYF